jgi:hypothetical protein
MIIEAIVDRCQVDKEIEEMFWEMFADLLSFLGIDFENDIDYTDRGTFIDSLRDMNIYVDKFPQINGYKVYKEKELVFEMVEASREMVLIERPCFKVELEFWSIIEEQIDLGE